MTLLRRYGRWFLLSAVLGCVAPVQMPLPGGKGRIDFGLQENFCGFHLESSSPGASATLEVNPLYELLNPSDPHGAIQLRLYAWGTNLPTTTTVFVDEKPVLSLPVRYGKTRKLEREGCWKEDPVTRKEVYTMCDVVSWEENKSEGMLRLSRAQREALAAALPDSELASLLSFYRKGSHIYHFDLPAEAIAFVRDPQGTCTELRAKDRPQSGS